MSIMFENRADAGQALAEMFGDLRYRDDVIVLGLPRGGVPVAAEVARAINAPLDVLLVRKVGTPGRAELAMGAIASGDQLILDDEILDAFKVTEDQVAHVIEHERQVLHDRERLYRGNRPFPDLRGKTVLLIDDGIATGSTMRVAVQAVKQQSSREVMVGVPVGPPDRIEAIGLEVDRIECVAAPYGFRAVGQWYQDFRSTSDEEVTTALTHG